MVTCFHLHDARCELASALARRTVTPHETACLYCTHRAQPSQQINRVTVGLALGATAGTPLQAELLQQYGSWIPRESPPNHQRLQRLLAADGPGSQLWRLLESLGIQHTADCACLTRAEQMNRWGVAGCRAARAEIVAWMADGQTKYRWGDMAKAVAKAVTSGLAWRLSILDPFGSLVDEAIRRSEAWDADLAEGGNDGAGK